MSFLCCSAHFVKVAIFVTHRLFWIEVDRIINYFFLLPDCIAATDTVKASPCGK